MANHKKAQHHHTKAGDAFKRGDMKQAAHHMGHALAALRSGASDDIPAEEGYDPPQDVSGPAHIPANPSLRDRLKNFKK